MHHIRFVCFIVIGFALVSCKSYGLLEDNSTTRTDEQNRRYDYFYLQAVNHKLAGRHAEAFSLFNHCIQINPDASEAWFETALCYMGFADSVHTVQSLQRAVDADKNNITYKEALAAFYLRHRNVALAAPILEDMIQLNSARSDVIAELVSIYESQKDYQRALDALIRIEQLEGRSMAVSAEKYRLYRVMGRSEEAFKELDSLICENPNDPEPMLFKAEQCMLVERYSEALDVLEIIRQKNPNYGPVQLLFLQYYDRTSQDSLYVSFRDSILFSAHSNAETCTAILADLIAQNRKSNKYSTDEIIEILQRVANFQSGNVAFLEFYSYYLLSENRNDLATDVLQQLLEIQPDNRNALLQSLRLAVESDDESRIISVCQQNILYDPENIAAYFYLGLAYFNSQPQLSLSTLSEGLCHVSSDVSQVLVSNFYALIGDLNHLLGNKDAAYVAYDSCLICNPNNFGCMNNYAYFLALDGTDLKRAEKMSLHTIIAEPRNITYLDTYAYVLFLLGRFEDAKVYIDRALQGENINGQTVSGVVFEHAGDIYANLNQMDEAVRLWMNAHSLGGDVSSLLDLKIKQQKYIAP